MLDKVNAVQKMQDYIEQNLEKVITLENLAREAGYSASYASRIFKELTGISPLDYIRARKLSRAAQRLRDMSGKILDTAFDTLYDSHEGFTRAFTRQFGITPEYYRKNTPPIPLFLPYSARDYYLYARKGVKINMERPNTSTVFVQVAERPARKLILKRGLNAAHYFEYCEELGCDVYGVLISIKEALYEPIGMWLPDKLRKPGTSVYAQGVEVPLSYNGEIPEGMEIIELPPCKMMVFQGPAYKDEEMGAAIDAIWSAMNDYKPEVYGYAWADEDAPRYQLAPIPERGYIEARPVRAIR
ncbi:MAG: helix-turn-helix domain-containing protein [Bacillota bacterium]